MSKSYDGGWRMLRLSGRPIPAGVVNALRAMLCAMDDDLMRQADH